MFNSENISTSTLHQTPLIGVLAVLALIMVGVTWILWRRTGGRKPRAAITCGIIAIGLHVLLFMLVPDKQQAGKGSSEAPGMIDGTSPVMVTMTDVETFDPDQPASEDESPESFTPPMEVDGAFEEELPAVVVVPELPSGEATIEEVAPPDLSSALPIETTAASEIDQMLSELLLADASAAAIEPQQMASPQTTLAPEATPIPTLPMPQTSSRGGSNIQARTVATQVAQRQPDDFANRRGPARRSALIATGGDASTEAAVAAGLKFLTDRQRPDGTWDPITSGAGQERVVLGHNRGGAGQRGVTAITGLAVLSLLGNGHTHLEGPYKENVARGLQALLNVQARDGSLGGPAGTYARMYCHGMATLAVSEAYAMTKDPRLAQATADALSYTARIQHPQTGGWRYEPGDTGDLAQFGWQAMALQSGRQAGLNMDVRIMGRLKTFLSTVRSGGGGLASYRPGKRASRTMTAEALASRLLLGHIVPASEIAEAEAYILQEPPGTSQDNLYFWYYASLALHQIQSPAWERWNRAMKSRLQLAQRADGSWPTSTVWGGYGGDVYTTAMGCLCLEVYYRHLTLHQQPEKIATTPQSPVLR